ncbi:MAG: DMT family transporter [Dehalococcoidales bacterium]|nr:DMT family transporter [Dehalococcoidales bacterium]
MSKSLAAQLVLLFVTAVWGSSFIVANLAFDLGVHPLFMIAFRFIIGSILMFAVFGKTIIKSIDQTTVVRGSILGVLFFVAFFFQLTGLTKTTPAMNAMITSGHIIFVPLVTWIFTKIRPRKINFIACAISLIGIVVITFDPSDVFAIRSGDALSLLGAITFSFQVVMLSLMCRESEYKTLIFVQFVVAGILSLIAYAIADGDFSYLGNIHAMLPILFLGVVCTFLCFLLEGWCFLYLDATRASLIVTTEAIFAAVFSLILGMDVFTWQLLVGAILLFGSIILMEVVSSRNHKTLLRKENG